tara:strand:- start:1553 stop:2287 length:735 start_codon:yes stop_codon:yes gene_type:complete
MACPPSAKNRKDEPLIFVYPPEEESFSRLVSCYAKIIKRGDPAYLPGVRKTIEATRGVPSCAEAIEQAKRYCAHSIKSTTTFHRTPVICREDARKKIEEVLLVPGASRQNNAAKLRARELEKNCYDMCKGDIKFPAFQYTVVHACTIKRLECVKRANDAGLFLGFKYGEKTSKGEIDAWISQELEQVVEDGKRTFKALQCTTEYDKRVCPVCQTWQAGNGSVQNKIYKCWNCGSEIDRGSRVYK